MKPEQIAERATAPVAAEAAKVPDELWTLIDAYADAREVHRSSTDHYKYKEQRAALDSAEAALTAALSAASQAQAEPAGWREFIENIAKPYSEPLNSVCAYRDKASRQEMMGMLRQAAQALLAATPAAPAAPSKQDAAPADGVLLPRVPTDELLHAMGWENWKPGHYVDRGEAERRYAELLAAAPARNEPDDVALWCELLRQHRSGAPGTMAIYHDNGGSLDFEDDPSAALRAALAAAGAGKGGEA